MQSTEESLKKEIKVEVPEWIKILKELAKEMKSKK